MERTIKDHFADWESHVFGFGYGSGEHHVLGAVKLLFGTVPDEGGYDYREIEKVCGPEVAWLLINTLCRADIIEYGTSPRFGWLTPQGKRLRAFFADHSVDDLVGMTIREEGGSGCYPDICNCGPDGYSPKKLCHNPFWTERA